MENIEEFKDKNILIIGPPAGGKTFLSNKFKELHDFTIIHTDDYRDLGFKESLYGLIEDIKKHDFKNLIIEGILGYRLLRKGIQLDCYKPDIVIEIDPGFDIIISRYLKERDNKKISSVASMIKANETVLKEYFLMCVQRPQWFKIKFIDELGET